MSRPLLLRPLPPILLLALLLTSLAAATSDITLFSDVGCTRSFRALDTTNGYPDGLCKPLNVSAGQSFQVQELDAGCVVTLYGANDGPLMCSSETKIVGSLATCYGDDWVYYSIDGCLHPAAVGNKTASASSSTSSSASSSPSFSSRFSSSSAIPAQHRINPGVVVGAVLATLVFFVLCLVGVWLWSRRQHKIVVEAAARQKLVHEAADDRALAESAATEKWEVWAGPNAVEIGRNSREAWLPPNPRTQIYWVS